MSALWERLREARKYAGLTQLDLAKSCGVSRGAVALWESSDAEHRTTPTTHRLISFSKATGVPLAWLMGDESKLDSLWSLYGAPEDKAKASSDVLPDLRQNGHLFVFAQTAEQITAKVLQLAAEPAGTKTHLIVVGSSPQLHAAPTAAEALATVVRILTA